MLIAGRDCWAGGAKDGLPIPGLTALRAGNEEFRVFRLLSGVTVRLCTTGAERLFTGGGETGGVDHENVAAGDGLFADLFRFAAGREGSTVEDDVEVDAFAHGSPPSISLPPFVPCGPPRTSASKSVPLSPIFASITLEAAGPPNDMNSLREVVVALLAPNSWSFRVCSFSTRADMDLMSVM